MMDWVSLICVKSDAFRVQKGTANLQKLQILLSVQQTVCLLFFSQTDKNTRAVAPDSIAMPTSRPISTNDGVCRMTGRVGVIGSISFTTLSIWQTQNNPVRNRYKKAYRR
jgi:hypothetical protein